MKLAKMEDLEWIYSDELKIFIGIHNNLPSNYNADVVYAKLPAKATLPLHFHDREGYEAFFFYNGANITVMGDEEEQIDFQSPFHLTFKDKEIHGIMNQANEDLFFEVLCAPKHQEGEEVLV